jgi:hypothetical protein
MLDDGNSVDGFPDRVADEIHGDSSRPLVTDSVHTGDGLEFECRVDEWLGQGDVLRVDEVAA